MSESIEDTRQQAVPAEKSATPARPKKKLPKNTEKPIGKYRFLVQLAFAALCIWIGVEFHLFVKYLESGGTATFVERPPGAEGFLPISSLMSLYYFFISGNIHPAHPAGLFILIAIIAVSWIFGKAFCSWICPVGLLSEFLGDLSDKVFGRRLKLPRFLDYPLRSLKYLLLFFFVYSIFFAMNELALKMFLDSPYNVVSDIKMYYFFADITRFALIVIGVLFLLSFVIRNFWCRYLCPYGALLGVMSLLSPNKIRREESTCIDCGKCAKACPSNIKVDKVITVLSDECTTCLACVDSCPIADTLQLETVAPRKKISKPLIAAGVVGLFVVITGVGMLTGNWQNEVTKQEYLGHQQYLKYYGHPTGMQDIDDLNKSATSQSQPAQQADSTLTEVP